MKKAEDVDMADKDSSAEAVAVPKRRKWLSEVEARSCTDPLAAIALCDPNWWRPQPHPSPTPGQRQQRPAPPLALALACCLCGDLLKEPITAVECSHRFCYDCIEEHVEIGGRRNVCPVPGCGAVLGPDPFEHRRLLFDPVVDGLVRALFPRPQLDAALEQRRAAREAATREAKAEIMAGGH